MDKHIDGTPKFMHINPDAVPGLVEALRNVVMAFGHGQDSVKWWAANYSPKLKEHDAVNISLDEVRQHILEEARAALAKAEGGQ